MLTKYTCKLDGFSALGTVGMPDEFWEHLEALHKFDVRVSESSEVQRIWLRQNVEEKALMSS